MDVDLTYSEGLLETTFGLYALLVCVLARVAGHLKLAVVRAVGLVLDRRGQGLELAVVGAVGPVLGAGLGFRCTLVVS